MTRSSLTLTVLDERYAICRMGPSSSIPEWVVFTGFISITRTPDELSIVCPEAAVPADVIADSNWQCIGIAGPLALDMVGVLASLLPPLAHRNISVFVISTYDTDYLMVQQNQLEATVEALRSEGHSVKR